MKQKIAASWFLIAVAAIALLHAENVARITRIEGRAELMRMGSDSWKVAKPNMQLAIGDALYAHKESLVELEYAVGSIVRLDANTKVTIEQCSEKRASTRSGVGRVWINARKLLSQGNEFEMISPTAVAAVRGTAFSMSTDKDSTTQVAVYKGTVAVGPTDTASQKKPTNAVQPPGEGDRFEVPGPEEIPGPYEVSLEEWISIVAGQMISVRKDGKFSQEKFDAEKSAEDEFIKRCMDWDKAMEMIKQKESPK
jgi:hypothetical protein